MHIEFRAKKEGSHIWIKVFVGKDLDHTLANAGWIALDPDQWTALKERILTNTTASLVVIREDKEDES